MAITAVLQSPPIWSPAYNPIVWMVESDETTQYRFRYVFDVYVQGNATATRFKTPPNPKGKGLIDVSPLIQSELQNPQNLPFLSSTPFYSGEYLATNVYIKVGEEYSTSPDPNLNPILYDGLGNVGEPAYGLYADSAFRPAPNATTPVVAFSAAQSPNTYYDYIAAGGELILANEMGLGGITSNTEGLFLTACPDSPQTIRSDENFTLTWLNRNFEAGATGFVFPFAMRAKLYNEGVYIGFEDTIATAANGGVWPTCSTLPPLATGASGPENYLYSYKFNPADVGTFVQDQEALFDDFGCGVIPLPAIFPGYHDSGLSPASNPAILVLNKGASYIQPKYNSNCATGFGVSYSGWSDLVYRNMPVSSGDVIEISIPSLNASPGTYPSMYLWGATGASSNPAKWEQILIFSESVVGGNIQYTLSHTTTKSYTALGLRWYSVSTPACGEFGCFSDYWNITTTSAQGEFDKICLTLQPYDPTASCEVGPTAMSESICLQIDDTNCWGFEPIRFTWLNQQGGRDWYTFIKRNTNTQTADRQTLYRSPGYWSSASYSPADNSPARYGTTAFNINLTNTWTASTDWITEEQSTWLKGLFSSSSVFAYLPGRSQPTAIIIQDGEYSVQTYARQKLFQYFISFVESVPDNTQSY